jgi:hypothetical protein
MTDETVRQAGSHEALDTPSSTADLLRQVADRVENPTVESHEVDIVNLWEWADALQRQVAKLEALVEVVTAIRADVAAIAEGVDPSLREALAAEAELNASQESDLATIKAHVSDLDTQVEHHGLLLARLLDKASQ